MALRRLEHGYGIRVCSDVGTAFINRGHRVTESKLTSKQRAHLRSLAHHLNPVLYIGKEGVTEASIRSAEEALSTRELMKVKVQDAAPLDARSAAQSLADAVDGSLVVQVIGRTFVLYRPHPTRVEKS